MAFHHERAGRKKARDLISRTGYAAGGHLGRGSDYESDKSMTESGVHQHERKMHPGEKETKLKLADGGTADGDAARMRGDKGHRGKAGGKSGKTHVNILIAPQGDKGGADGGLPTAPPVPPRPMPPPPGAGMPPGMPPGGMPPGMPPGGGMAPHPPMPPMAPPTGNAPMGVGAPQGGMPPMRPPMPPGGMPPGGGMPMRKAGGRTPKMHAGAGSGEGRLEKIGWD